MADSAAQLNQALDAFSPPQLVNLIRTHPDRRVQRLLDDLSATPGRLELINAILGLCARLNDYTLFDAGITAAQDSPAPAGSGATPSKYNIQIGNVNGLTVGDHSSNTLNFGASTSAPTPAPPSEPVRTPPTPSNSSSKYNVNISGKAEGVIIGDHTNNVMNFGAPTPSPAATGPGLDLTPARGTRAPRAAPVRLQRYKALLVGVSQYTDRQYFQPLPLAYQDVSKLGQTLEQNGYEVTLLHNQPEAAPGQGQPTFDSILNELRRLTNSGAPGDLLWVYFAGHGVALNGEPHLVPAGAYYDTMLDDPASGGSIPLARVMKLLEKSPAQVRLLFLDACHTGVVPGARAGGSTLDPAFQEALRLYRAEGVAVIAACKEHQTAWDYPEKQHGAFTYFLLQALQQPHPVTLDGVKNYLADAVVTWAQEHGRQQTPMYTIQMDHDVALLPG